MQTRNLYPLTILLTLLNTYSSSLKADHDQTFDFSIGGRIKFDTIYNFDSVGGSRTSKADLALTPASIPLSKKGKNELNANLRESRLWATIHLPFEDQKVSTYVEFDFFNSRRDSSGQAHVGNDPRLRHLYLSSNNFTIGKTYTTLTNLSSYPEINDANGPLGVTNIRQEIIRYNKELSGSELFLAIEKPESTFTSATGSSFQVNNDQIHDIIGKLQFTKPWGNWSLAGIIRQINPDDKIINVENEKKWGGGISVAGRMLLPEQDNLRFTLSYGNAIARYVSFNTFDDATINNNGNVNLTEITSAYVAYQHWWSQSLRSSFIIGAACANQDTSTVPDTVDQIFASTQANLIWSPDSKSSIGFEWTYAYREIENGSNGQLNRLQLSAIYKF
jgi:hypothetical protein